EQRFIKPSPRVLVCVPCRSTQVERRAIRESVLGAGARDVKLIEEPMAAAIGAGLPVEEASGNMVVDIGGGTSEIAILSLNGVVYSESVKIGGDKMDESITSWIRRNYGCVIGESTAEKIKYTIGCATAESEKLEMSITGRNLAEGIPETFTINSEQIFEAMRDPLYGIVRAIRNALELSPPELAADIAERGIVLTGGGALMRDLDKLISSSTGIPVICAEDPLTCVARGGGQALEIMDKYNIDLLSSE
ncbi:MAG: rod shape-determining protein, partial [Proteobacteria bacterium]|nr:rod shape-determining protein [Pseudomonadota bacterium]